MGGCMARYVFCGTTFPQNPKPTQSYKKITPRTKPNKSTHRAVLAWMPDRWPCGWIFRCMDCTEANERDKTQRHWDLSTQRKNAKDPAHVLVPCLQAKRHRLMLNRTSLPIFYGVVTYGGKAHQTRPLTSIKKVMPKLWYQKCH